MDAGQKTLDWLYREQLQVDGPWSIITPQGFTWWADRHAQQVEVIGSEPGPDGNDGYFVRVKTDFIGDVTLSDRTLASINLLMSTSTMSGLVYENTKRTLSLSSLVRVHEGNRGWMSRLISVAAMLQIADAHFLAASFSPLVGGASAESAHPTNGFRLHPDELAVAFVPSLSEASEEESPWSEEEFQGAVDQHMRQPPISFATASGRKLTVIFHYGDRPSLCEMDASVTHPRYGHGLLILQSFPCEPMADDAGTELALTLNAEQLDDRPAGYGFGSYCYRDGRLAFSGFIPNAAYMPGLLPNHFFACAARAVVMVGRLNLRSS